MELTPKEKFDAIKILKAFCIKSQSYEIVAMFRDIEKQLIEEYGFVDSAKSSSPGFVDRTIDNIKITQGQFDYIVEIIKNYRYGGASAEKILNEIREVRIPIIRISKLNNLLGNDDDI